MLPQRLYNHFLCLRVAIKLLFPSNFASSSSSTLSFFFFQQRIDISNCRWVAGFVYRDHRLLLSQVSSSKIGCNPNEWRGHGLGRIGTDRAIALKEIIIYNVLIRTFTSVKRNQRQIQWNLPSVQTDKFCLLFCSVRNTFTIKVRDLLPDGWGAAASKKWDKGGILGNVKHIHKHAKNASKSPIASFMEKCSSHCCKDVSGRIIP